MTSTIPFDDFGGSGPLLHFSHANGYPPACYQRLIIDLAGQFHVIAMHQRPLWPGSRPEEADTVQVLVRDTIRYFEQQSLQGVIGVGHSLGAIVSMMAALERPELFRALVLIEPIFLMPAIVEKITAKPPALWPEELPIVNIARSRRSHWDSRQEAFNHFRRKGVFSGWSEEALWDYVQHGLEEQESGKFGIIYSPDWEAHVYTLMLQDVWKLIPRITHPTLAVRGVHSDTLAPAAWEMWRLAQPQASFVEMEGAGHLLTMEKPHETAREILRFLEQLPGQT